MKSTRGDRFEARRSELRVCGIWCAGFGAIRKSQFPEDGFETGLFRIVKTPLVLDRSVVGAGRIGNQIEFSGIHNWMGRNMCAGTDVAGFCARPQGAARRG